MSNGNFTNGSVVFRVWSDGSGDIIAKFQYMPDAQRYAEQRASEDDGTSAAAFIAFCDFDCDMRSYRVVPIDQRAKLPAKDAAS